MGVSWVIGLGCGALDCEPITNTKITQAYMAMTDEGTIVHGVFLDRIDSQRGLSNYEKRTPPAVKQS